MEEISVIGRNTMGRTLVRMDVDEHVVSVARAESADDEDKGTEPGEDELIPESEEAPQDDDELSEE